MKVKVKSVDRFALVAILLTIGSFLAGGFPLFMKFITGEVIVIIVALFIAFVFKIELEV